MKRCPICNTQYDSRIEYCFRDGARLDASVASSSNQKLITSHLDSMGKHSMDSMETLDNISIDDLLQIGGGGFQGFGDFAPVDSLSPKGNKLELTADELQLDNPEPDAQSGLDTEEPEDIENILDSFGSDVGAHLDDTLDGIQVGQILNDSTLDMPNSNEILPGDTRDVLVDGLDVPTMTESDLNRFHEATSLDELDAWEASGPIMQEAARDALAHHRNRTEDTAISDLSDPSSVVSESSDTGTNKVLLGVGAALLLIVVGAFAMSGQSDSSDTTTESTADASTQEEPEVPMVPMVPVKSVGNQDERGAQEDASGTQANAVSEKSEDARVPKSPVIAEVKDVPKKSSAPEVAKPSEPKSVSSQSKPRVSPVSASNSTKTKSAAPPKPTKKPTPAKPKVKKKTPPPKPKTEPKPIPQKDPQEDNGWGAVQTGGWGVEVCGVTVKSNVSSAKVYIDGVQKGTVGKSMSLDCGQHKMEVRSEGYQSVIRSIDLTGDASFTIELSR